jgi:hypothetical protein
MFRTLTSTQVIIDIKSGESLIEGTVFQPFLFTWNANHRQRLKKRKTLDEFSDGKQSVSLLQEEGKNFF